MKMIKATKDQKTIVNYYETYEVWVLMENYNVWHKHTECIDFEMALKEAQRLENKCKCFTEIKYKNTRVEIYRRYEFKEGRE